MTITVYDVEQRSPEWYQLRCGMVTASVVGQLLTPTLKVADNETSRGITASLVAERLSGHVEPTFTTDDMWRGIEHEPIAREYYAEHHGPVREAGFIVREWDGGHLGYSPDGLVGEAGLVEIKCPRAKGHVQTILADAVPDRYVAQCQAALVVTGREWIDYVSFHAGLPLFVKRVHPDPRWWLAITVAVNEFELNAVEMVANYRTATAGLPATERVPTGVELTL